LRAAGFLLVNASMTYAAVGFFWFIR